MFGFGWTESGPETTHKYQKFRILVLHCETVPLFDHH